MEVGAGTKISLKARLDTTNPRGIHIGKYSVIAMDSVLLSHDFINNTMGDVHIGDCCFIGTRSIIYSGVTIGDHSIVSAAAVVLKDVPPNCIVAGNPARIVEMNIRTGKWGMRLPKAEAPQAPAAVGGREVATSPAS
jgi:acetyltransferase-like isoleucine patch superfamily enzyme